MAYLIGDGFDYCDDFGLKGVNASIWDVGPSIAPDPGEQNVGRFAYGGSLLCRTSSNTVQCRKRSLSNEQIVFCAFAVGCKLFGGGAVMYITLFDGGTAQFTIEISSGNDTDTPGSLIFRRGGTSGTVVATWADIFPVEPSFDQFQVKVKIDNSVGEIHVRRNGATSDDFSATGIDTQATGNAYCNGVDIGTKTLGNWVYIDDFLMYSAVGNAPNDWVGDIRAFILHPVFDTAQKDFAALATGTSLSFGDGTNTGTKSLTAGTMEIGRRIESNNGGYFTTASIEFVAGFTGTAQLGLYFSDGNVQGFEWNDISAKPGHLIAVSNPLVNPTTGVNVFTFPGNVPVMKGYEYYFAVLSNTSATLKATNSGGTLPTTFRYSVPGGFGGGFPLTLETLVTSQSSQLFAAYTTLTTNNAVMTSDQTPDFDVTYVFSNVAGEYDLYELSDLFYVPSAIIGMNILGTIIKTDAGGRTICIAGLSGATPFETDSYTLLTSWSYTTKWYENDPDTGVGWTAAAVNALQIGPKVKT